MNNFSMEEMQKLQQKLQEKYKDKWEPIAPETGKNKLLCFGISVDELQEVYMEKHQKNMKRW